MTDYADKTDAELDALAAERMGEPCFVRQGIALKRDGRRWAQWSPTTDANDRDEWVEWLRSQELAIHVNTLMDGGWRAEMYMTETMGPTTTVDAATLGRAVLIAGLRATDE